MRACIQRVTFAKVEVEQQVVGQIGGGLLILLGVEQGDQTSDLTYLAEKCIGLRIFEDEQGKMNHSVLDCGGQVLLVSQFTLMGNCKKGKRPSFVDAAPPEQAKQMYQDFAQLVRQAGIDVATGVFQADMQVSLCNDGPVTILLDSRKRF